LTALAVEADSAVRAPHAAGAFQRLFEPSEVTLEDTILGAWEALTAHGRTECPVCHGEMAASGCETCGTHLS
jgi:DnaJ-class molecular chaperone